MSLRSLRFHIFLVLLTGAFFFTTFFVSSHASAIPVFKSMQPKSLTEGYVNAPNNISFFSNDDEGDELASDFSPVRPFPQAPNLGAGRRDELEIQKAFDFYSGEEIVSQLIAAAREQINVSPNPFIIPATDLSPRRTMCYGAVRSALMTVGMLPPDFHAGIREGAASPFAADAARDLSRYGFVNLLTDSRYFQWRSVLINNPMMAPRGALLVYKTTDLGILNGVHRAGHIEIKTQISGTPGYISISETNVPTYGKPMPSIRMLTGVLIKEN